jgi:hypothetical protein
MLACPLPCGLQRDHKRPIRLPLRLNQIRILQRTQNAMCPKSRDILQALERKCVNPVPLWL